MEKTLFSDFTELKWVKWTERKPAFNGSVVVRWNGKWTNICLVNNEILRLDNVEATDDILEDAFWLEETHDTEGYNEWRQYKIDEEEFSKPIDPERLDFGWVCRYFNMPTVEDDDTDLKTAVEGISQNLSRRGDFYKNNLLECLSPRELKHLLDKKILTYYPETDQYYEHYTMRY